MCPNFDTVSASTKHRLEYHDSVSIQYTEMELSVNNVETSVAEKNISDFKRFYFDLYVEEK